MQNNIKIFLLVGFIGLATGMLSCKKTSEVSHNPSSPILVDSFTASSGGVGTEILISGSNFSADTSQITVMVNGHKLALVNANVRQIMAVVPAKCGSGNVIVKIGNDSAISTGIFNYTYSRVVSTLAGDGKAGFSNGAGTDAEFNFNNPTWYRSSGIAVDDNLNVYVADPGNHCIRKIDSLGNVTTLAGNPASSGYADGKGTAALFIYPYGVAVDAAGNVYSVDPINWDIRKITPDGTATTWAWGGQDPWTVAVDKATGYVYYASNRSSGNIYQVTDQWTTNLIISGQDYPAGMVLDKSGNLYVAGNGEDVIRKFDAGSWNGNVIAGTLGVAGYLNGTGTAAQFAYPCGLALDSTGNILVAGNGTQNGDITNPDQSIRLIQAGTWEVSTFAGSGAAGYADAIGQAAAFSGPVGVAIDKNGTVYVLDKNNNRIRKIISE